MIVQKFGGTSMGSAESINNHVIPIINGAKREGESPIVVVSAMSGVTNSLLRAGSSAMEGDPESSGSFITSVRQKHHDLIMKSIFDDSFNEAQGFLDREIARLKVITEGIGAIGEISPRVEDKIMAIGEKLSAGILSCIINSNGGSSEFVDLENIGQNLSLDGEEAWKILEQKFRERLGLVGQGITPIVTGFFGRTRDGLIKTVGRGYSDFTAALAGAAMGAGKVENWTDVDGILTTNPQMVREARLIRGITYDEISELSHNGAKVLHPLSIEPAKRAGIPVHVRNTFDPSTAGTMITTDAVHEESPFKSIAYKKGVTVITIDTPRMLDAHGYVEKISNVFARHRVPIDLISTSAVSVSISVDETAAQLESLISELKEIGHVKSHNSYAVISLVGSEMKNSSEIWGRVFSELAKEKIQPRMISMGNEQLNLNIVVDNENLERGIRALHHLIIQ